MHMVRQRRLGVPQDSREAFDMLVHAGFLEAELGNRLKRMVGFRNIAVHTYEKINWDIVHAIVTRHLDDFRRFIKEILRAQSSTRK